MKKGLNRRNLFKFMAIGGTTAVAAGCEQKPEKIIPALVPPVDFEYMPNTGYQYMTTCRECDSGTCGMMITTREYRAQKAEGNPNHPHNQGALCALGQASLQTLYNPERHAKPISKGQSVSWEDAQSEFVDLVQQSAGQIVYLGRPTVGSEGGFIDDWLNEVGGGKRIAFSLISRAAEQRACEIAFGRSDLPDYAFENAELLVNFGADFIETWGNGVEQARRFTDMHAYQDGKKNRYVHVGPQQSLSGAQADEWIPTDPGTEALIALAMAHVIHKENQNYSFLSDYLAAYPPEMIASSTGISTEKIQALAAEFQNVPSLALAGGIWNSSEQATAAQVAIFILNAVAGNLGKTLRFHESEQASDDTSHSQILQLLSDLNADKVKLLIVDDSNPLYTLPASLGFAQAIKKTKVVALAAGKNETNQQADLVLPALTAYESWGDATPRPGIFSIQQPVMAPVNMFDARARENVLLAAAKQISPQAFTEINNYRDYIYQLWAEFHQSSYFGPFENFWIKALENGGVFEAPRWSSEITLRNEVTSVVFETLSFGGSGLALIPAPSIFHLDGRGANKPWLQEVPHPISQIVWDSWAEIHPDTAKKLGIKERSVVEIRNSQGSLNVTVYLSYTIHRNAVAIPIGQGHTASGIVADGFGVNVLDLLPAKTDKHTGNLALISTNVEVIPTAIKSYTVNLDGNPRQLGRDIAAATTVAALTSEKNDHGGGHHRPKEIVEFYPDRSETAGYYKPYRWGMVIDLDRCTGCSACVVACYAENNIPVVGKERAAVGREMSWLRMERYLEGYQDETETRFAPIMCQQCSNAGCEPVCPVYATYHNPEGLNAMIYNRCVGTRYCSNNCIYKARRYNWFNYEFPAPLDQQLNSGITTRAVGVMEKCNFCVQRLTEAKYAARDLGRDVQDGEVVTACQQTCASKAIVFGNLADPESKVSQFAKRNPEVLADPDEENRDRQYEIFPEMNYKPAVTYLRKVNHQEVAGLYDNEHGSDH
jgi:molybdopterin-containing oxidoreductase family iron-sulfur binding subunit